MTFEPAMANSGTITLHGNVSPNDPAAVLDGEPLRKMIALHQRAQDIFATVPPFEDVQEAANVKTQHANRIADLTRTRSEGGFGQPDNAGVVVAERHKLERATAELKRVQTLKEIRSARWNAAAQLEHACVDWLLAGGVPGGCVIKAVADVPITELLKKGERIADAVERYRIRLRELAADLHKVRSSHWPSSVAKAAAKAQIDALAEAAAPDIDRCIEHGLPVSFPTVMQTALVRGTETPALAFAEAPDAFGFLCWMFRDQVLAKINEDLDAIANDEEALSEQQRQEMEAQISNDMLSVERSECSLIWRADASGDVIDFRNTTSPQAVLGIRLVTPRQAAPGTTGDHAYDLVGLLRQ